MKPPTTRTKWLMWPLVAAALLITVQAWNVGGQSQGGSPQPVSALDTELLPTAHPAVPARLEAMWYVPASAAPPSAAVARVAKGVQILDEGGDAAEALSLLNHPAGFKSDVGDYARYYAGVALQRLDRLDEADAAFAQVAERKLDAQLPESALYRRAEIREARQDYAGAVVIYDQLLARKPASPQVALVKMAAAAGLAGDSARAVELHRRVLREFALSAEAAEAERLLDGLGGFALDSPEAVEVELGRAEALFNARRFDRARAAFTRVRGRLAGDDQHRVTVRLAQIDAALGNPRLARDVFRRYIGHATLGIDAQYGMLAAARSMGQHSDANALTEDFVARYPAHPRSEEALNEMARRHVLDDDDKKAAEVYTRMVDRFPDGAFAERGAWKAGWWAYREKNFAETIRVFERGAAHFPRSDYRPPWLYWSARSYDQMGQRAKAVERYRLTATDYLNSYYGRLAWKRLEEHNEATVTPGVRRVIERPPAPPPNHAVVQALIAAGLYRPALNELQYAQRVWGDSAPLQATVGFVHNRMNNLRLGITAIRRAYPQFLAAGGEDLPLEILRIIFPIDYWPLLKGHAQAQGIDPYVLAALAAQESTFDPKIRSSANAIGLLQIIPPTGRRLAQRVGMRNFSERSLENPEVSARLGTRYFGDMVKEFGGYHYALAGYNAGEHRVRRWNREAPGLPQDEWIDNIPYAETQNYVKRILGTAEDYRRLYPDGQSTPAVGPKAAPVNPSAASAKKAPAKNAPPKKAPPKKAPAKKVPPKKSG